MIRMRLMEEHEAMRGWGKVQVLKGYQVLLSAKGGAARSAGNGDGAE